MDTVDTRSASVPEDGEKIIEIQLERLRTFKNHPFKVRMDQEMIRLSASVEKYGIINPLIVRPIPDGVYEIISGHRRKAAAEKFGYRKVPVIIRVMSDDEAVINMVDSNLQREQITFSEKAFAYKMKNEAMKRTGGRRKSSQSDYPLKGKKTVEIIGEEFGDSAKQVQRYLKLTDLIPELLEKLDNGELSFNPAVELSYLTIEEQKEFIDAMEYTQAVPSISQAQRMKKLSREKKLTGTIMREIMGEIKKGEITRVMCRVIAISNQKGGVGKTTTTVNLGIGLARQGKKVLLIDADPQGSLTASLGYVEPDEIGTTLATIMMAIINEKEFEITDGILHHKENVDLLPANIELSALEVTMGNVMSRELIMKEYIEAARTEYDYILIDCMPSLGLMTINALVAADSVLIPVQAAYLPVKGLQQLIHTIAMVKKRLNRQLVFEGILLTMVDFRTNYAKDVAGKVREAYGEKIEIFDTVIPMSVKAAETSAEGVSIFSHCLNGKVAKAYETIAKEVLRNEE